MNILHHAYKIGSKLIRYYYNEGIFFCNKRSIAKSYIVNFLKETLHNMNDEYF